MEQQELTGRVRAGVVARVYDLPLSTVYAYADRGVIPAIRIGRCVRFDLDAVRVALERGGQEGLRSA